MKILKVALLSLLVTICAVAGTVTIMHFAGFDFGGKDADPARINTGRNSDSNAVEDTDNLSNIFDMPFAGVQGDSNEDYRLWQRAMEQQADTGHWKFFPLIPYDKVLPGEKVVLNVSTENFVGWEVDDYYANVELFDEIFDEENAYVSFIMPEDKTYIAALYTEKPYINYENQRAERMAERGMYEQGSIGIAPQNDNIPIQTGAIINLPIIQLSGVVNVTFGNPTNLIPPPGAVSILWEMNETGTDALPTWLTFSTVEGAPIASGISSLFGFPPATGIYRFYAVLTYLDAAGNSLGSPGNVVFIQDVRPDSDAPVIATTTVPDGMVGIDYKVTIQTFSFNPEWTWGWTLDAPDNLPTSTGLLLLADPDDSTKGIIIGTPDASAVGTPFTFKVLADTVATGAPPVEMEGAPFSIRIWPQPAIESPKFYDEGMELQPFNTATSPGVYSDIINVPAASTILPSGPPGPVQWGWERISGNLPNGLDFAHSGGDITKLAITGTPATGTATDAPYSITVKLKSNNESILIGETKPITIPIKIWSRPAIKDWDSFKGKLPDGMVGPGSNADEPPPDYYPTPTSAPWTVVQPEPIEVYAPIIPNVKDFAGARIEAYIPEGLGITVTLGVPQITWSSWTGDKPTHTPGVLPPLVIPNSNLTYSTPVGQSLTISGNTTDLTKADDYSLNIGFSIEHGNPNIDGARVDETFDLRIWRRAYLSVRMQQPGATWTMAGEVGRSDSLEYRSYGRAVIPGEEGTISTIQTNSSFVRWEVVEPNPIPFEILSPGAPLTSWPGIGNNWELTPPGLTAMAWCYIRMPKPAKPDDKPINVIINGFHVEAPRVVGNGSNFNLPSGEKDINYTGAFLITNWSTTILGDGPGANDSWSINSGSILPNGVALMQNSNNFWGPPTETENIKFPETFPIFVDLTLKGTMTLTYGLPPSASGSGLVRAGVAVAPFTMFIDIFRPNFGDVDGVNGVNMADLVLLTKWIHGDKDEKANAEAIMKERNGWRNGMMMDRDNRDPELGPGGRDLQELNRWFAINGAKNAFD